jgi:hypothetical protein
VRYYDIKLSGGKEYTSQVSGANDPGALNVEFDVAVVPYATPMQLSAITIWGTGLQDISQAENLVNQTIQIYGGMATGLPLATAAAQYAGLLFEGWVFQAFANWIGTAQTLNLIVAAGTPPNGASQTSTRPSPPRNLVLNWKKGQTLQQALTNTLNTGFSGFTVSGKLNSGLVLPYDMPGFYANVTQLALWTKNFSAALLGGTYPGADIALSSKTFTLYDNSQDSSGSPKQIQFQDLIGQPTWIKSPSIQFKTPMRADINVGDLIKLPPTVVNNTQQAQSSLTNQNTNFQGNFKVTVVRHVGNFRQPTADAWVSIFDAVPMSTSSGTASTGTSG